jgi:hypothetical protein
MPRRTVIESLNVDSLTWLNFDDLYIDNGATVTVSTPQVKCWINVNVNNGELRIVNTSSTVPIRFLMGRNTGATANIISGSSGLGTVTITGSWIYLQNGNGLQTQSMSQPYTDFVPAVWVETTSGSNIFEPWLNITSQVGENLQYFYKDLEFANTGSMGNFFIQETIKEPYPSSFTGSLSSSLSSSIISGVSLLYSSSIYFGDGINGNVIPSGSRVRIPNIMVTDVTRLNLLTATSATQANFVGTTGCVFNFNTVLFDESYGNFTQPQVLEMKNCAWAEYPLITECYSLNIENVAFSSHPPRRYFPTTNAGWTTRDLRWGTQCAWSYISNANINGLYICNHSPNALLSNQNTATAITTANTPIYLSYCNNLTVNKLKVYQLYKSKNFQYGLILNYVNNSTFTNLELYGGDYYNILNSANNTFTNTTSSFIFGNSTPSFTSAWRVGTDPSTNQPFILGQKYYLKTRAYRSWQDPTGSFPENNIYFYQTGSEFVDSLEYSFTPYTASRASASFRNHPDYFGVIPAQSPITTLNAPSASLTWVQRAPTSGYEIYRYTESKSSIRDGRTLVYSSSTAATVTFIDTSSVSKPLNYNIPNYYVLRKIDSPGIWSESEEQECVIKQIPSASNFLRQSSGFSSGEWVKTNVTVTADQRSGPNDVPIATAAAPLADLLLFTNTSGNVVSTSSFNIINGNPYVFSIYLSSLTSSVSMSISASSGPLRFSASYVIDQRWTRAILPFTAGATTASVGIFGDNRITASTKIFAFGAHINTGSITAPYVNTTTTPVFLRPSSHELTSVRVWSRGDNGSGVEVQFGAVPAGTLWWELHVATSSNFTPTKNTLIANSWARGASIPINLNDASNNIFSGLKQITPSGYGATFLSMINASSNNRFLNFDINYHYAAIPLLTINTLANNNFLHNWNVKNYRNYVATAYWLTAINNSQGLTIQNLYCNNADIPLSNLNLDVNLKNVSAANGRPGTTVSTYTLAGSTTDQNAISYGQVYDTIFNEFVWNPPSGSMHIAFNASVKHPSPYIITGNLYFSNTGRLYFNSTGSIEYTWPWKIYGISGFRNGHLCDAGTQSLGNALLRTVMVNTIDLGDLNYTGYSLKREAAFKTGNTWSQFYEMTDSNESFVTQSFDPYSGFNMKIRLTARPALKFDGQGTTATSSFIIGEFITGSISSASALIVDMEDRGTTGTLVLDAITGSFRDNETLKVGVLNKGLANGTGSIAYNPSNILLPQPTSYINAIQWFTVVNTSSLYPISSPTLTVTGMLSGSKIDIIKISDSSIMDAQYINTDNQDYTFTYDYFQDTPVYLVIQNLGYVYQRITTTLTSNNLSIPVQQTIDRNYENPINP